MTNQQRMTTRRNVTGHMMLRGTPLHVTAQRAVDANTGVEVQLHVETRVWLVRIFHPIYRNLRDVELRDDEASKFAYAVLDARLRAAAD